MNNMEDKNMMFRDRLIDIDDVGKELLSRLTDKAIRYMFIRKQMYWSEFVVLWNTDFPMESMFLSGDINK